MAQDIGAHHDLRNSCVIGGHADLFQQGLVVPLTVTVDAGLKSPPNPDSPNLLSWDAAASDATNAVRFLVPVELYRPGSSTPVAPPKDYLTYLQGQTKDGAELSKATKITVDGYPATLMNVTTSRPEGSLNGSLGCPNAAPTKARAVWTTAGSPPAPGRHRPRRDHAAGLGPHEQGHPDPAFVAMFEHMLSSVRLR
jgi:hypothetical protein